MIMKQGKEYLTISEIAKLCDVSVAMLKHYDKISLLKPDRIDEATMYRYYSISQYEAIETIRELRELDVPLVVIKEYMDDRNLNKSLEILKKHHTDMKEKIDEMQEIMNCINEQIALLEKCQDYDMFSIRHEYHGERRMMTSDTANMYDTRDLKTMTPTETSYSILTLEMLYGRDEKATTLARGRLGMLIPEEEIKKGMDMKSTPAILLQKDYPAKDKTIRILPEGEYACLFYRGEMKDRDPSLRLLLQYLDDNGYEIVGDAIHLSLVDETISDDPGEFICDIQIPIQA